MLAIILVALENCIVPAHRELIDLIMAVKEDPYLKTGLEFVSKTKVRGVLALLKHGELLLTEGEEGQPVSLFLPENIKNFQDLRERHDIFLNQYMLEHHLFVPTTLRNEIIWQNDDQKQRKLEFMHHFVGALQDFYKNLKRDRIFSSEKEDLEQEENNNAFMSTLPSEDAVYHQNNNYFSSSPVSSHSFVSANNTRDSLGSYKYHSGHGRPEMSSSHTPMTNSSSSSYGYSGHHQQQHQHQQQHHGYHQNHQNYNYTGNNNNNRSNHHYNSAAYQNNLKAKFLSGSSAPASFPSGFSSVSNSSKMSYGMSGSHSNNNSNPFLQGSSGQLGGPDNNSSSLGPSFSSYSRSKTFSESGFGMNNNNSNYNNNFSSFSNNNTNNGSGNPTWMSSSPHYPMKQHSHQQNRHEQSPQDLFLPNNNSYNFENSDLLLQNNNNNNSSANAMNANDRNSPPTHSHFSSYSSSASSYPNFASQLPSATTSQITSFSSTTPTTSHTTSHTSSSTSAVPSQPQQQLSFPPPLRSSSPASSNSFSENNAQFFANADF
jgi:hypothetical protein